MPPKTIVRSSSALHAFFGLFFKQLEFGETGMSSNEIVSNFVDPVKMYNSPGYPKEYSDGIVAYPGIMYYSIVLLAISCCIVLVFVILRGPLRQLKSVNVVLYSKKSKHFERVCFWLYIAAAILSAVTIIILCAGVSTTNKINNNIQTTILNPVVDYSETLSNGFDGLINAVEYDFNSIFGTFVSAANTQSVLDLIRRLKDGSSYYNLDDNTRELYSVGGESGNIQSDGAEMISNSTRWQEALKSNNVNVSEGDNSHTSDSLLFQHTLKNVLANLQRLKHQQDTNNASADGTLPPAKLFDGTDVGGYCESPSTTDEIKSCLTSSVLADDPALFIRILLNIPSLKTGATELMGELREKLDSILAAVAPLSDIFEYENMKMTLKTLGMKEGNALDDTAYLVSHYPTFGIIIIVVVGAVSLVPLLMLLGLTKKTKRAGGCGCRLITRLVSLVALACCLALIVFIGMIQVGGVELSMMSNTYILNTDANNQLTFTPEMDAMTRGFLFKDKLLELIGINSISPLSVGWMEIDVKPYIEDVAKMYNGDVVTCEKNHSSEGKSVMAVKSRGRNYTVFSVDEHNDVGVNPELDSSLIFLTRLDVFVRDIMARYSVDDVANYLCGLYDGLCGERDSEGSKWTARNLIESIAGFFEAQAMNLSQLLESALSQQGDLLEAAGSRQVNKDDKRPPSQSESNAGPHSISVTERDSVHNSNLETKAMRPEDIDSAVKDLESFWDSIPNAADSVLRSFAAGTLINQDVYPNVFDCVPLDGVVRSINSTFSSATTPSMLLTIGLTFGFVTTSICIVTSFFGVPVYNELYLEEYKGRCDCRLGLKKKKKEDTAEDDKGAEGSHDGEGDPTGAVVDESSRTKQNSVPQSDGLCERSNTANPPNNY